MKTNTINLNQTITLTESQQKALQEACDFIAPTWPLDQWIAVNPWWELRDKPIQEVAAQLAALAQVQALPSKSYFEPLWLSRILPSHLEKAMQESGIEVDQNTCESHLLSSDEAAHWHNISDLMDSGRDRLHRMAWRDEITHQISQFCAFYFHDSEVCSQFSNGSDGFYHSWLKATQADLGIEIIMAEDGLTELFQALPDTPEALIAEALRDLQVSDRYVGDYAHALLLDMNGWASWVAYERWQDRLNQQPNGLMMELLAIRLAWELVLWRYQKQKSRSVFGELKFLWRHQLAKLKDLKKSHAQAQQLTWIWQRASEIAYQEGLHEQLQTPPPAEQPKPLMQAAFCIDVRSEVMRRSLEAQDERIQTLGFAGFFGLPMEYQAPGSSLVRPQLPGLLKPNVRLTPILDPEQVQKQKAIFNRKARWLDWGSAAPATFSMVEASGLLYAFKLLRNTLFPEPHQHPVNDLEVGKTWALSQDNQPLSLQQLVDLAAGILKAMGLNKNLAQFVLLVGHGSQTCNNPHAAGLDCGACGGQTGELNVRVLAYLLNRLDIREGLMAQGIDIPETTEFIAALHNTTTDDIKCFDIEEVDEQLEFWLENASDFCRQERALRLGLPKLNRNELNKEIRSRAKDWSQVRPEWGLANNASFIVAPRHRTAHLNLQGRSFLHDYNADSDSQFGLLELIMTAPMVVTNWINLQYYASVCDNYKYGSGNKVLHNVVGGNIGVFEGNGGDLRIGLSMQSIHNGEDWMHEPLRLSVYIDAPQTAIEDIAARHEAVGNLIKNEWLFLFHWGKDGKISRFNGSEWLEVA
ncbi:YbcC family protein [Thiosulfativibrio zosterae]|uniref:Probable inorganic carbon transporter subunit DabA n=1 Tax=Thiosulfativibrio zosterae TaxID=2675053 RepID=A0A6F8PQ21_9GAMM|nr:DUF2309 domain-containing protein [Thiosulfativibrio zosterae]BBP44134.1 UPF0753 protein [Thiosulfativibrio zosterae]